MDLDSEETYRSPSQAPPAIDWKIEMPLLTSRFFLYDGLKLFVILGVSVAFLTLVISGLSGSWKQAPTLLTMFGWIVAGLLYLFTLIAWVIFRNRFLVGFRIDEQGVAWRTLSKTARAANRLALVTGALRGNPGQAGAGLLAMAGESGRLRWDKVRRIKKYPAERVITVMNSWRVVIRLYCTPDNYACVASVLDGYTRGASMVPATGGR